MSCKRLVRLYLLISLFLAIGFTYANPLPAIPDTSSMPQVWDNLNGTAGEPLSLYDIYLVDSKDSRVVASYEPINTLSYWDSLGGKQPPKYYSRRLIYVNRYSRTNLPISYAYGISRFFEIELRRAFITRRVFRAFYSIYETPLMPPGILNESQGFGDFSIRLRTKILGEKDQPFYLALGVGIKLATTAEVDANYDLPISPGSTDLFFGIYNAIKLGKFTFPVAVTYSHTSRYLNSLPMGEIITYRIGLIIDIHRFIDLNYSLKGYEITEESNIVTVPEGINMSSGIGDKITEMFPQGISKTTAEIGLSIKIPKFRAAILCGIITDLRGKRTYYDDISSIFSMQIGF